MLPSDKDFLEFWDGVHHFANMVLKSHYFTVIHDGPNCGGGVGLVASLDCSAEVLVPNVVGLLEPLSKEYLLPMTSSETLLYMLCTDLQAC